MRPEFRKLRLQQLERSMEAFQSARKIQRPPKGWIRALREASGMTLRELAMRMTSSTPSAAKFEKSEAEYRITLNSLRRAAEGLGCELVYALVPKQGSILDLAEHRAREEATNDVLSVEHTMALEDQGVGGVEQKIEEETKRKLRR